MALPVFASAAPFLIAAGTAIPIALKAANLLARPHVFYEEHVELNFARPGVALGLRADSSCPQSDAAAVTGEAPARLRSAGAAKIED